MDQRERCKEFIIILKVYLHILLRNNSIVKPIKRKGETRNDDPVLPLKHNTVKTIPD